MKTKTNTNISILFLFLFAVCGSFSTANAQTLTTDHSDYSPGTTALLTGTGFGSNEIVTLQVLFADNTPSIGDNFVPWDVTTDANGAFMTEWNVCNCPGSPLRASATGQTSLLFAQAFFTDSDPVAQALPYSESFSALAHSSATYPAGWIGWQLGSASSASFRTNTATADLTMNTSSSASTTAGGIHNYNGKIGALASGSSDPSVAFAVNTTGYTSISVAFDVMTIRNPYDGGSNTRINQVDLQYRVGTGGVFTSVSGSLTGIYQNNTTTQTGAGVTTPQNPQSFSYTLPAACNNQPVVQLRWAQRDASGAGSRPGFAYDNINISGNPFCTAEITVGGPTTFCSGGSVLLTATAGASYLWSNSATTQSVTVTSSGSYTVQVTFANSCVATSSPTVVTVNNFQSPVTVFTETMGNVASTTSIASHESANGFDNIAFTYTGTGDVRNTQSSAGTYTGASGGANIFITQTPGIFFQAEGINTTGLNPLQVSFGIFKSTIASTGTDILVEVSSDGINYNALAFSPLPTGSGTAIWHYRTATGIIPSTGNLRIRFTQNGSVTQYRIDDLTLTYLSPDALISASGATTFCAGGSVTLTASNGNSYAWSTAATTQSISVNSTGSYAVTVTDGNGCTDVSSPVAVSSVAYPVITNSNVTNVSCSGGSNGSINISAAGEGTLSYVWSNAATTEDISGLSQGTYTVTVTVAPGCSVTASFTVTQPPALTASCTTDNNVSCNGGSNGQVSVTAGGGTPGYTYLWSNASITPSIGGLSAGTYTVTVTDANGCTASCSRTLTEPSSITATCTTDNNVSCNGGSNGQVSVTAGGGTPGYTYLWSNASITPSIGGLSAGTYTVTVTDDNGCTASCSRTLTEPSSITATCTTDNNVSCNGGSNGQVSVTAGGGTPGYTYLWSNASITSSIGGLSAGTYTVTVTDVNGCTATCSRILTEPTSVTATCTTDNNVSCNGGSNGQVSVTAGGGTPGFTYLWSNAAITSSIGGLSAGTYTVTVTDTNGCTATCSRTLTEPSSVTATCTTDNNVSCNGGSNGQVSVTAGGGTPGYTYLWSNTAITPSIGGLSAGTYTVTVTDANGCTATCATTVTESAAFTVSSGNDETTFYGYLGDQSVTRTAVVSGGTGPYSYSWSLNRQLKCNMITSSGDETFTGGTCTNNLCPSSPLNTNTSLSPLCTGSATVNVALMDTGIVCVTVTDAGGCTATDCFTIYSEDARCFAGNSGNAKVKVCHRTNSTTNPWVQICVDESVVAGHLAHGDYLGKCGSRLGDDVFASSLEVQVYPNPNNGLFTLDFHAIMDGKAEVIITDMLGQVVYTEIIHVESGEYKGVLNANELSKGYYMLQVIQGNEKVNTPIVVIQ